jgi:adenosine kinase
MTALICGSVAYDTVMVFDGRFRDHILPDRIHMLNVAFLVPGLRRNFGGCAGNIGYNLKLLGGSGHVMATVGMDFAPYRAWMHDCGLSLQYLRELADEYTAQAYITTDADNNQITAFHPGAMNHAHVNAVPADAGITLGLVGPESRAGMTEHAGQFAAAGVPFLRLHRQGHLGRRQRLRGEPAVRAYRPCAGTDRRQGAGAGGDPRRRGVPHLRARRETRDPRRQAGADL